MYSSQILVAIVLAAIAATYLLTAYFRSAAIKSGQFDIPNQRSSHTAPTPRGGGIAIIAVFYLLAIVFYYYDLVASSAILALCSGGAIVALIGYIDDRGHVAARWRLAAHLTGVSLSLSLMPSLPALQIFNLVIDIPVLIFVFLTLASIWTLNLYNFMDGIDGIAGIESLCVAGGMSALLFIFGDSNWYYLTLALAACSVGFLLWNWPPAKVFMGDACSGFLGFALIISAVGVSAETAVNFWSWLILFSVFFIDATLTLFRRLLNGERVYEAHRKHAYQKLSRKWKSHKKVTLAVSLINILWLLPLAFFASAYPFYAALLVLVAWFPLLIIGLKIGAGEEDY